MSIFRINNEIKFFYDKCINNNFVNKICEKSDLIKKLKLINLTNGECSDKYSKTFNQTLRILNIIINILYVNTILSVNKIEGFEFKFNIIISILFAFIWLITAMLFVIGLFKTKYQELCSLKKVITCINNSNNNNITNCQQNNSYLIKLRILEIIYLLTKGGLIPYFRYLLIIFN